MKGHVSDAYVWVSGSGLASIRDTDPCPQEYLVTITKHEKERERT